MNTDWPESAVTTMTQNGNAITIQTTTTRTIRAASAAPTALTPPRPGVACTVVAGPAPRPAGRR